MRWTKSRLLKTILGVMVVVVVALFGTRIYLGTNTGVSAVDRRYRGRSAESLRPLCAALRLTGETLPAHLQRWMCWKLRVFSAPDDQDRIIEMLVPPFRKFRAFDVNTSSPIVETLKLQAEGYSRLDTVLLSTRHEIIDALLDRADSTLPWRSYRDLIMVHALSCPLDDRFRFDSVAAYRGMRPLPPRFDENLRKWWETEGTAQAIKAYREWWKTAKDPLASTSLVLRDNSW